jgi:hypothetical protein
MEAIDNQVFASFLLSFFKSKIASSEPTSLPSHIAAVAELRIRL